MLVGVISVFTAAFALVGGAALEEFDPTMAGMGDLIAAFALVLSIVFIVIAVLNVVAAVGIFTHRSWARWLGIVLAALGVAIGVLALLGLSGDPLAVPTDAVFALAWLIAYAFVIAALAAGSAHFRPIGTRRPDWG